MIFIPQLQANWTVHATSEQYIQTPYSAPFFYAIHACVMTICHSSQYFIKAEIHSFKEIRFVKNKMLPLKSTHWTGQEISVDSALTRDFFTVQK